ncbi:MAG: hypothetical protein KKD44_26850, partial [Proteobacteria bacterium]|nr:hypothetical protein [Pseudomonadota bacterium]
DKAYFTADEAAQENQLNQKIVDDIQDTYDKAQKARENWVAENPMRQPVFPDGPLQAIQDNPANMLNPLLYTETIASTLPYTMAGVVLIAGGGVVGGPAGAIAGGAVSFGFTMAVEGHNIYEQAMAAGDTREHARMLMTVYGALSSAVETGGDAIFVGGLGRLAKTVMPSLGKNVAAEVMGAAAKKYGWKNLTADVIMNFINQSSQEAIQEIIANAAVRTVDENRPLLEGAVDSFVAGAIGTAPFVLIPAGGTAIKMNLNSAGNLLKKKADYEVDTKTQATIVDRALGNTEGFVNTEMIKDPVKAREVAALYNEMGAKTRGFAQVSLALKQVQKAMSDMSAEGLEVKSKKGAAVFNALKEQERKLSAQLKALTEPLKASVNKFTVALLANANIGDETIRNDIGDMSKNIVRDIDTLTLQVLGERDVLEINKEIRTIEAQIQELRRMLEAETLTPEQLEAIGKLVDVLSAQVDALHKEAYKRYLGTGEEVTLTQSGELQQEIRTLAQNLVETSGVAEPETTIRQVKADWRKGRVDPYYGNDTVVQSILSKERSLGWSDEVISPEQRTLIDKSGLKVHDSPIGNIIYDPSRASMSDLSRVVDAFRAAFADTSSKSSIRANIAVGRALQYTDNDIAAYLREVAMNWKKRGFGKPPWTLDDIAKYAPEWMSAVSDTPAVIEPSAKDRAIRLGAEREFFEAMQSVYDPIWGKESYGEALSKLEDELETLLTSLETSPRVKPAKIIRDIFGVIKRQDPKRLRTVVASLQLEAGKVSPALQLSIGQLVQTAEDLMNQFQYRPVSKPETREFARDVDFSSLQANKIKQQVERIIANNWQKLTERLSSSILRRSPQAIREYLEERFSKEYIDNLLNPDRVEQELRDELRRQEDLEAKRKDIELHETEQKLSESFRDKTANPDTKRNLDEHAKELKRQVEEKKKALQVAEKEKLVIPLTQVRELAGKVKD